MIAITSISPSHKNFDVQITAVESWTKAGYEVVSLNSADEISLLKDFKLVKFVKTNRHNKKIFGKPYVLVSAIIDYLKEVESEYSLIINSDIIIKDENNYVNGLKEMSEGGIVVFNRVDYENDINVGVVYELGFDGFFINGKHLDAFPQSILCLGQCHWDLWLPYVASLNGVNIIRSKQNYLYHKKHSTQYSKENWIRTAEIFRAELGIFKYSNVGQVIGVIYRKIKQNMQ